MGTSVKVQNFGTIAITDEWKKRYGELVLTYTIPAKDVQSFPVHSPLLTQFNGRYDVENKVIPQTWYDAVDTYIKNDLVKYHLSHITFEEYVNGQIDETIWKNARNSLRGDDKKKFSQSPKIGSIIKGYDELDRVFNDRGGNTTKFQLLFSTLPESFVFMSHGSGWSSCQHFYEGSYRYSIEGNIADPYVAIVALVTPGESFDTNGDRHHYREGSLHARALVRLMHGSFDVSDVLYVDQIYSDTGVKSSMLLNALISLSYDKDMSIVTTDYTHADTNVVEVSSSQTYYGQPVDYAVVDYQGYQDNCRFHTLDGSIKALSGPAYRVKIKHPDRLLPVSFVNNQVMEAIEEKAETTEESVSPF